MPSRQTMTRRARLLGMTLAPVAVAIGILPATADQLTPPGGLHVASHLAAAERGSALLHRTRLPHRPALTADTLCLDSEASSVRWLGTKVGGKHEGTVAFARGFLSRDDGGITGGAFTVDMRTIAVTDIPPHEVEARRNLLAHLAHDEFFAVNRFPTAEFAVTSLTRRERDTYVVSGDLTIRDSVHNVTIDAVVPVLTSERVRARATFSLDRRRWGVRFNGLTSLIRNAIVHNAFQLRIDLIASIDACHS